MDTNDIRNINEQVAKEAHFLQEVLVEINKVMIGQERLIERVLIGLLADGHILLEGVPGLAKTLLVKTVSQAIQARFARIQFTPDLLPADLLGTQIYNPKSSTFSVHKGPIFANIILADEINRAPAKVQSALLEAMQERQVTIGETTFKLEGLFIVLATQNPIEQEGTYPLPEAQMDRFMMKVRVNYPSPEEERRIIDRMIGNELKLVQPVVTPEKILQTREVVKKVYIDEKIKDYVLNLVLASRSSTEYGIPDLQPMITYGASPRAGIYLLQAARAHAFIKGRGFVTPEDIKQLAPDILRHRIIISYEAEAENLNSDDIVQRLLNAIQVP